MVYIEICLRKKIFPYLRRLAQGHGDWCNGKVSLLQPKGHVFMWKQPLRLQR